MFRISSQSVVYYFYLKDVTASQIKSGLGSNFRESSPSNRTVKWWVSEFRMGRKSTSDEPRSGRPNEVINPEMILEINKLVIHDRKVKVRERAEAVGISSVRIRDILHENLDVKQVCPRWMPRLLTLDQKQRREDVSTAGVCHCISAIHQKIKVSPPFLGISNSHSCSKLF